jgi:histidine phosphotransferase ChpT
VTDRPLRLAELVCARVCHDLSGLLGSLVGVLELAAEDAPGSEALALAGTTAGEMRRRLDLLRAAWAGDGEDLDLARLRALATALPGQRITLELSGLPSDTVFGPRAGRLVLNLLLLAAEALPVGGCLALTGSPAADLVATIAGPRAGWPASLAACLSDPTAAGDALTGPRALQAPLLALLAHEYGVRLALLASADANGVASLVLALRSVG